MATKIVLPDQLNIEKANHLREKLYKLIEQGEREITIDFTKCEYIDSTGLGVLVSVHKKSLENKGNLTLCSMNNEQVKEIFKLTRLDKVFKII